MIYQTKICGLLLLHWNFFYIFILVNFTFIYTFSNRQALCGVRKKIAHVKRIEIITELSPGRFSSLSFSLDINEHANLFVWEILDVPKVNYTILNRKKNIAFIFFNNILIVRFFII